VPGKIIAKFIAQVVLAALLLAISLPTALRNYRASRFVSHGNFLLDRGQGQAAAEQYEAAVRLLPEVGEYHYLLARAYAYTGALERAVAELGMAQRDYRDFNLYLLLGLLHQRLGDNAQALAALDRGLSFARSNDELRTAKAGVLINEALAILARHSSDSTKASEQAELQRAANVLEQAFASAPSDPAIQALLAEVLLLTGNPRRAAGAIKGSLELAPGQVESLIAALRLCAREQMWDEALRLARLAAVVIRAFPEKIPAFVAELEIMGSLQLPAEYQQQFAELAATVAATRPDQSADTFRPGVFRREQETKSQ